MDNQFSRVPTSVIVLGGIIGGSLVLASIVASMTFYNIRALDNVLSATGSAKISVEADHAKWIAQFSRTIKMSGIKAGYTQMASDLELVKKFYVQNGIQEKDLDISQVYMDQDWSSNPTNNPNIEKDYILRQTITVNSDDVQKISALSKNVQGLINQGVVFQTQNVEYTYSKLPELRVSLLGKAVEDARARASEIAKSSGKKIGDLKSASSGVVQVLSKNSVDVSDYGTYDTFSIEKDIMVTTKAVFTLK